MAVLCDRNAIEIKRYGHPMGFPKTPKMVLVQAVCGRGQSHLLNIIIDSSGNHLKCCDTCVCAVVVC